MISNLYTWILPAAIFIAAGLSNLGSSVNRKRNPERARRNKVVWFSLNISIALCFISGSVFFVDWPEIIWSLTYLYFTLAALFVFYLVFVYKNIISIPLVFIFTLIVLFFNIYFQEWTELPDSGELGKYRILSFDQNEMKIELSGFGAPPVFLLGESSVLTLTFEVLQIHKILFFINSDSYYRMSHSALEFGFSDIVINFLVEKSFLLSGSIYSIDIEDNALLYQYSIVLDNDQKKISIEN